MNNRMNAYILFGNDDVDDAADDRDEVEYIPRVTEVILLQQPTARATMLNCLIITVTVTDTLTTDTCLHEIMCAVKAVDSLSHGKEKRQRNKTPKAAMDEIWRWAGPIYITERVHPAVLGRSTN